MRVNRFFYLLACFALFFMGGIGAVSAADMDIKIVYIERQYPSPPVLSIMDRTPEDEGIAGSRLAIKDNNTSGQFLGHTYALETHILEEDADFTAFLTENKASLSDRLIISKLNDSDLLALSDAVNGGDVVKGSEALIFNTAAYEDSLRNQACRGNVLHTIPSDAMRADALAQFAKARRLEDWVLIHGENPRDLAFADALERSASKFRLDIEEKAAWALNADIRRSANKEILQFTQRLPDHDLMVISDEIGDFSRYFLYNSWQLTPIAGGAGLMSDGWHIVLEQAGAAQLQNRFFEETGRYMRPIDYAAWVAARVVGEAVSRTQESSPKALRDYILSDKFSIAAHKHVKLTFRHWNGQLRQPVALFHEQALLAMAPLDGFHHQRNPLDSLGLDLEESSCNQFAS